jgi:hypothetical protein
LLRAAANPKPGQSNFESAHNVPQAVGKYIPGYNPDKALTNNFPHSVHRLFDFGVDGKGGWQKTWDLLKRSGQPVTASDIQKMLNTAVDQIPEQSLSLKAKGTLKWQIELELYSTHKLDPSSVIVPGKNPGIRVNLMK